MIVGVGTFLTDISAVEARNSADKIQERHLETGTSCYRRWFIQLMHTFVRRPHLDLYSIILGIFLCMS